MKRSELLELIAGGENSGVEFKRDDLRPEQLAREVVALANFQRGRVLLGVEDDGAITGIRRRPYRTLGDGFRVRARGASNDTAVLRRSSDRRCTPRRGHHRYARCYQTLRRPASRQGRHLHTGRQHVSAGLARAAFRCRRVDSHGTIARFRQQPSRFEQRTAGGLPHGHRR